MTPSRALWVPFVLVTAALAGCPEDMAKSAPKRPADALVHIVKAAQAGDVEAFKAGLSKDFIATVERYQELGRQKGELAGAFEWPIFMRSLARSAPQPKEELVEGNRASVRAVHADGRDVKTALVLEDGAWRLAVPAGMVKNLDHFDDVAKMVKGEPVEVKPNLEVGGGGEADRVKNLPPDATDAQRLKAQALDTFDLGDLAGAQKLLAEALEKSPGDEELTVALGRAHVQSGKGEEARALYESYLKSKPDAVRVLHYLGMAFMMLDRPADAAAKWKAVLEKDPEYGKQFKLDQRVMAAESMAAARAGDLGQHGTGVMPAPPAGDGVH